MKEVVKPTRKLNWSDRAGSVVDSFVSIFSPTAGAARRAFRMQLSCDIERRDRGPGDVTRGSSWLGSRLSPDSELEESLDSQREKSRELYHHDSIGGAIDSRANLVVSDGFTPQARIKERAGFATKEQAKQWNQELEDVYAQISPSICQTRKRSLWQLSKLVEKHHGCDGESITILSDRGGTDRPIPMTLAVVDPMRLQTPPGLVSNPRVRLGIEYDDGGQIIAYHIRNSHPNDTVQTDLTFTRYEADRVLHVFEPMAAEQSRGLPWLSRALNRVKDAGDLDEAALIAEQIRACHAAFITPAPGQGAATAADLAATGTVGSYRTEEIRPGMIKYLDREGQVTFSQPSSGSGYDPIQNSNFHRIAAGINYPFEMLTKNWAGLSFAAGRLSLAEARQFAKSQQRLLREMWFCKIWERMVFESVLVGAVSIPARTYNRARWWFNRHEWTAPAWPFAITPMEEIKAAIMAVDENIRTKASVCAEYGGDLEEVFEQRRIEREMEREFDIDPASSEVPVEMLEAQEHQMAQEQTA